jgi:hypothetical protein
MTNASTIREHMKVVGSCGNELGTVDHLDGNSIKLTRNDPKANGQHHWIPIDWVESVGQEVRLNKNCGEATRDWQSQPIGSKA